MAGQGANRPGVKGTPRRSRASGGELVLTLPDPEHRYAAVRLDHHLTTDLDTELRWRRGRWLLRQPVPDLDRLEYGFTVVEHDGAEATIADPTNPRRAGTPFGDRSWLPMPGYRPPRWWHRPSVRHHLEEWALLDTPVGRLDARIWSPASAAPTDDLGLLVVHDGPEMASLAGLTRYIGAGIAAGSLPPTRVALLSAGPDRSTRYGADEAYAEVLAEAVGVLRRRWPSSRPPVAAGSSLGALAALHAQWRHPGTFGGLWLASGSWFTPETDPGEAAYHRWPQVTGFVAELLAPGTLPPLGELAIVCGTAEENIVNNRLLLAALTDRGAQPTWGTVRDGHHHGCWRDLLDPHLGELLRRTWTEMTLATPASDC